MDRFGSGLAAPGGERRDPSVMSIASLIESRNGNAGSRITSGLAGQPAMSSSASEMTTPRLQSAMSPPIRSLSSPAAVDDDLNTSLLGSTHNSTPKSPSRDPRPSYTEEQKFFIMWARIVQERGWTEIEDDFARIFNQRTKGGLTSVYYRIRKSWKLKDVLSNDPCSSDADRQVVAARAFHFSRGFLRDIGYAL